MWRFGMPFIHGYKNDESRDRQPTSDNSLDWWTNELLDASETLYYNTVLQYTTHAQTIFEHRDVETLSRSHSFTKHTETLKTIFRTSETNSNLQTSANELLLATVIVCQSLVIPVCQVITSATLFCACIKITILSHWSWYIGVGTTTLSTILYQLNFALIHSSSSWCWSFTCITKLNEHTLKRCAWRYGLRLKDN